MDLSPEHNVFNEPPDNEPPSPERAALEHGTPSNQIGTEFEFFNELTVDNTLCQPLLADLQPSVKHTNDEDPSTPQQPSPLWHEPAPTSSLRLALSPSGTTPSAIQF